MGETTELFETKPCANCGSVTSVDDLCKCEDFCPDCHESHVSSSCEDNDREANKCPNCEKEDADVGGLSSQCGYCGLACCLDCVDEHEEECDSNPDNDAEEEDDED